MIVDSEPCLVGPQHITIQPPDKPSKPILKQVVTNDVTTEKLAVIMNNNPRGIMRFTDELVAFMRIMNLYHGGHGADRQFYLSCWSGSTAQVDRKNQDAPILISEPFVTVLGGIQPEMLCALEEDRGREDGFMDRFLFCTPKEVNKHPWSDQGVSPKTRQRWRTVVDWLFDLAMKESDEDSDSELQPRTIPFTNEAKVIWKNWHKKHHEETLWDCFPPHLRGVWSKFDVHALSLVLIAHMLKIACEHALPDKEYTQVDPPIDADSMYRGLKLADYFKDHCVRVFNRLKLSGGDLKAEHAIQWIRKRKGRRTDARELVQNGLLGIKTASEAKALLKDLEDRGLGELKSEPGKNARGKKEYFQV